MIDTPLPGTMPETRWIPATNGLLDRFPALRDAWSDACRKPGWNPRTVKLDHSTMAIDFASDATGSDKLGSVLVAEVEDHPILATLPANAPKVIKHIYRKDVRLRYLRMDDAWSYTRDMTAADEAAKRYNAALRSA